ncbi:YwiC-like family protein [Sanguibacter sp. A247]|uniref:YwiC-like family protein n=1 Tax=unclassified Sanguibacter TaxID=2645534 RepID=UPI003FD70B6F
MADVDTPRPQAIRPRRKRRRSPGWVPDQHGAWAMLIVPLALGVVQTGPTWIHLPLSIVWILGYLAFYATGQWLRSHRKARWFPPVRAYVLACIAPGLAVLVLRPDLLIWAAVFAPLLAVSLVLHHQRKDRTLLNDVVTVVAGCLVLPVAHHAGLDRAVPADPAAWAATWVATALTAGYFIGTIPYVKTLIREKGSRTWYVGSVAYHLVLCALPWALVATTTVPFGPVLPTIFYGMLAVRAALVPPRGATPLQAGIGEIVASIALAAIVVVEVF